MRTTPKPSPRDPEAEHAIIDGLRRAPNAAYTLVQTALVQDEALKRADAKIRELSGSVQIQSEIGRGTRMSIKVPLTLAILPTLLVEIDGDVYALPLVRVVEVLSHTGGRRLTALG